MKLSEAIELIGDTPVSTPGPAMWADLGCGAGLFTHALAQLLSPGSTLYAIDKDVSAWNKNPQQKYHLDGIMMANSFHFVRDKISLLKKLRQYIKAHGFFLIVEYDMDTSFVSFLSLPGLRSVTRQ